MMQVIKTTKATSDVVHKPMHEMEKGEVCYVPSNKCYVLCVQFCDREPIHLILSNHGSTDSYASGCPIEVRTLEPGESITIRFS